jgi:hypothetical protein
MLPWLSPAEALRLHTSLVADSLGLLRLGAAATGATPFVSFSEAWEPEGRPECADLARAAAGLARLPQSGADLGERLSGTFRSLFAVGFRRVVVIGADSPTLPSAYLTAAFERLHEDAEVVLGPAEDGGYYLVGAMRLVPLMFEEIPWGTGRVMQATLAALKRCGLRSTLLPRWYDVDRPADLERMRADAPAAPGATPATFAPERTRAFIADLVRDGRLPHRRRGSGPA